MIDGRRVISAVICGLIVTAAVHADMIPLYQEDTGRRQIQPVYDRTNLFNDDLSDSYNFPGVTGLSSLTEGFLPQANTDLEQTSKMQHLQSLTNGPDSLNLCLSALIGLGLCSSVHFVKRLSFNFVPEWFHDSGPFQIGHSHAITPESLCTTPVYCFVQPIWAVEDFLPIYRLGTITSLWRKSQFTLCVLASRGPPLY